MQRRNFMKGFIGAGALLPLSQTNLFASAQKTSNYQTPALSPQLVFFKNGDDEFKVLLPTIYFSIFSSLFISFL